MELSRISTCSYPLREKDVEYAFKVISEAGFKKVDLWGRAPHFAADPAECDLGGLMELSKTYDVKIANLGTYPGVDFAKESEEEREKAFEGMKATIDAAATLGTRSIRFRPGEGEEPGIIDRVVPLCRESAAYAESKGVYLGMENHRGSIAVSPELCVELCEKVGSRFLGVLYEPCNLWHAKVDYKKAFETFRDYVVHIHVKDGRWDGEKFARTMLGEGDIDVRWIVQNMESIGYDGDYALEYEICDIVPIEEGLPKWLALFLKI